MSTLTLLRHGQAAFGADHYDQLSSLGILQAQATAEFFRERDQRFDQICIGPRQRHRLTADGALSLIAAPAAEIDDGLDEFAEGGQVLKSAEHHSGIAAMSDPNLPKEQRLRLYAEEIARWANGEIDIAGTRSAAAFRSDVIGWVDRVTQNPASGQQVLAVTSAGVIAVVVCAVMKQPLSAIADCMRVIQNASLTSLVYSRRGMALQSFNGTAHLPKTLLSSI